LYSNEEISIDLVYSLEVFQSLKVGKLLLALKISPLLNQANQKCYSDFHLSETHPTFALRVRHLLYADGRRSGSPSGLYPLPSALKPKALYLMGVITAICCQCKHQAEEDAVFAVDLLCCLMLVGMLKSPGFSKLTIIHLSSWKSLL
jgi:hypothetical protein